MQFWDTSYPSKINGISFATVRPRFYGTKARLNLVSVSGLRSSLRRDLVSELLPVLLRRDIVDDGGTLLDVANTSKQRIHLLKRHLLRLGKDEVHDDGEARQTFKVMKKKKVFLLRKVSGARAQGNLDIDSQSLIGVKDREELLEDRVGNTVHLSGHADSGSSDVHGENLAGIGPGGATPSRLVEECEEEGEESDGDSDRVALVVGTGWCETNDRDDHRAHGHTARSNEEQESAAVSVDSPHSIEGEENTKSSIQRVDEVDGVDVVVPFLVDGRGVTVERSLSTELLSNVDEEGEVRTLADTGVPE